jgi:hypothetical protein
VCKNQQDPELENKPNKRTTINHIFSHNHNRDKYKLKHKKEPKRSRGKGSPKDAQMRKEGIQSVPLPQVWIREDHPLRMQLNKESAPTAPGFSQTGGPTK